MVEVTYLALKHGGEFIVGPALPEGSSWNVKEISLVVDGTYYAVTVTPYKGDLIRIPSHNIALWKESRKE